MHKITLFLVVFFFNKVLLATPLLILTGNPTITNKDTTFVEKLEGSLTTPAPDIDFQYGNLIILFSVTLITILTLLTFSLYKINKIRAKANFLLQQKNTELIVAKDRAEKANKIKEHLNSLRFSGEYLLSLINNILDLNKLEANKVGVEMASFNLKKRISDVLVALTKAANDRKNKINFHYDENIPNKIKGDSLKISQILINLVGNAIKFTKNGVISIFVKVDEDFEEEGRIRLYFEIEDNGVGISDDKQEDIFDSFSQESQQINRMYGGSGLGLSIVKNLLELLGSQIRLRSEVGKGSRFYFKLDFETVSENEVSEKKKALQEIDFELFKGKKILVVEDNKINQLITRKILEKQSIICEVADNGDIAIEKAKNLDFNLILMDIHMPGISGVEASRLIRGFDTKTPIIALTAVTLEDHIEEFYANGITDVIPKPYKTEEFYETLQKAFTGQYEVKAISIEK